MRSDFRLAGKVSVAQGLRGVKAWWRGQGVRRRAGVLAWRPGCWPGIGVQGQAWWPGRLRGVHRGLNTIKGGNSYQRLV